MPRSEPVALSAIAGAFVRCMDAIISRSYLCYSAVSSVCLSSVS